MSVPQPSNAGVRVMQLSHDHARRLGHAYVGTEHLLLALVHSAPELDHVLLSILQKYDLSPNTVETAVLRKVGHGKSAEKMQRRDSDALKLVYQRARVHAYNLCSDYVRPRHMLAAIIPESFEEYDARPTTAASVLRELGMGVIDREAVIEEVRRQENQLLFTVGVSED